MVHNRSIVILKEFVLGCAIRRRPASAAADEDRGLRRGVSDCRPREGGDPYAVPSRQTAAYGSRAFFASLSRPGRQGSVALMRNRAGNFSVGRLMEFLTALGQDVRITVKPTKKRVGEMEVVVG